MMIMMNIMIIMINIMMTIGDSTDEIYDLDERYLSGRNESIEGFNPVLIQPQNSLVQ
jgi:hypothetical protein